MPAAGQKKSKKLANRPSFSEPGSTIELIQTENEKDTECGAKQPLTQTERGVDVSSDIKAFNANFGLIDKKLDLIAISMGVRGVNSQYDHEEDRKGLKEKLRQAIEADRRSRVNPIVSHAEVWLEYLFGICHPDKRLGKRGSR